MLLIRAFFCWWTVYLKLGVNQFFRSFHFVTVEAVFLASGNRFFIDYFIRASGNGFYGWCFFYSEQTLCWLFELRWSHFLKSNLFPTIGNHFQHFFRYSCWSRQLFRAEEMYLFNKPFVRLSSGNSILLLNFF